VKEGETLEKQGLVAGVPPGFETHPHWQLVQRIIASPQFVRSARLKTFLLYVTRCALLNQADQVTEQQIGVHVFGRPADYNAGEDNIVRSQARFLRVKLAEYFESPAGQDEPILLDVPKGTYLPRFGSRAENPASAAETSDTVEISAPQRRRAAWWIAAVGVCVLLAAVVIRERVVGGTRATDASVWPRIFDGRQQTTIVASDYIYSMVQEAAGRTLTLDEYLGADYFNRVAQLNAASGLDHLFPNIALRHYTGFENVNNVARMISMKAAQSTRTVVRFARDLTMRDVSLGNLVLMGSKQSNPWVLLFEPKLNYRFEYQSASHNIFIVNRAPQNGEQTEYKPSALDATSRVIYGVIAFLPNLNRGSNVLIFQGTSMSGSEVALDVLDNPALFHDLLQRLGPNQDGTLPYFEALIQAQSVNGVAAESSIVACRVIAEK
jgi:hypothetical protein